MNKKQKNEIFEKESMFKIISGNGSVIYCTDVRNEVMKLLKKRYSLEYSIMTNDDMISFAIESKIILSVEPSHPQRHLDSRHLDSHLQRHIKLQHHLKHELVYDMDPYFTCQRVLK
jgi:hypothetical protein